MIFTPQTRLLAVFAHPDDAELTCFGTLARVIKAGGEVYVLVATRGHGSGTDGTAERVS